MNKLTFLIIIIFNFNAFCQEKLNLQDAINIALKNNYDIQLAKNNVDAALINNYIGVAGGLPTLNGTASDQEALQNIINRSLTSSPTGTGISNRVANGAWGNTLTANVTGSLILFNGMRVVAAKQRLEMLERQNKELLNLQIQNTIANVMVSYYDIVRQQSYQKTIERSISASEMKLNIIENQQKVGVANNADLFQAQVDLNNLKQSFISQNLIITQSQTDFLALLNAPSSSAYTISDSIIIDRTVKIDSILEVLEKNPEIVSAGLQVKINEQLVKETASQRYPTVRLNAGFSFNRQQSTGGFFLLQQTYGPFVGASLNLPIYNGDLFRRQEQIAKITTSSSEIQKKALERTYEANSIRMWQAYTSALQQLETGVENYKIASKLLDLVTQKFELRQATIVDVKLAQQSFENAGYSVVNLSFAAKAAEIELKRIAHKLSF